MSYFMRFKIVVNDLENQGDNPKYCDRKIAFRE